MAVDFPFDDAVLFSPDDDSLHPVGPHRDWTETIWFSFHVPERDLMGWLYAQMRPNIGTVAGGAFVYTPPSAAPWEVPYYAFTYHTTLPDPLDIRDVVFPNGVSVKMVEPGMAYDLGYQFRDHDIFSADLHFEGITPPVPHLRGAPPFVGSSHYDQHGRVTGELRLRGETIPVDCVTVRDRSWGRRPELLGRRERFSYCYGATGHDEAFLAFCFPPTETRSSPTGTEKLSTGYLLRDNKLRRLAECTRTVTRRRPDGVVDEIVIDAVDTDGRTLHAISETRSALFLQNSQMCVNAYLRWQMGTSPNALAEGWGEDQDIWSLPLLADRIHPVGPST